MQVIRHGEQLDSSCARASIRRSVSPWAMINRRLTLRITGAYVTREDQAGRVSRGQVEGLVGAERRAPGVGPVKLLLAEVGAI